MIRKRIRIQVSTFSFFPRGMDGCTVSVDELRNFSQGCALKSQVINRKLSEDQIILICKLLVEKNGIRAIERIMEIHRDTVSGIIEDLAHHAREVTDFLIHDVGLTKIQVDEMWSFIKKTKEH